MRVMYRFGKHSRLKFVSHLDLQRVFQMAVRRTDLPIAYSQGFNPHPLVSFASALAMGWTSDAEIADIKFEQNVSKAIAFNEMAMALPPDLPVFEVRLVDDRFPAAMSMVRMADYDITLGADYTDACEKFLSKREYMAIRKTKSGEKEIDIRPLCRYLDAERTETGCILHTRLSLTETDTLKPDLLVRSLTEIGAMDACACAIHRVALLGERPNGTIANIMEL